MASKFLLVLVSILILGAVVHCGGGEGKHHKVIIHVPYKIHTVHHHATKKIPVYHYYEHEDHHHHHHHHHQPQHHEEVEEHGGWD